LGLFSFRLEQPAGHSSKGLDALDFLTIDQPDEINSLPVYLAAV
jgi:hypothetical protein